MLREEASPSDTGRQRRAWGWASTSQCPKPTSQFFVPAAPGGSSPAQSHLHPVSCSRMQPASGDIPLGLCPMQLQGGLKMFRNYPFWKGRWPWKLRIHFPGSLSSVEAPTPLGLLDTAARRPGELCPWAHLVLGKLTWSSRGGDPSGFVWAEGWFYSCSRCTSPVHYYRG